MSGGVWTSLGFDPVTVLILGAGCLGGFLRALVTKDHPFASKRTVVDVISSGAVGLLLVASGMLPDMKPAGQAAIVLLATYVSSDLVTNVMGRFNLMMPAPTRRAADRVPEDKP